jgi:hypothetical protein
VANSNENPIKSGEIRVLLNIGEHFIEENQIQSVSRFGKGTKIVLNTGEELVVRVSYDRVAAAVSGKSKK